MGFRQRKIPVFSQAIMGSCEKSSFFGFKFGLDEKLRVCVVAIGVAVIGMGMLLCAPHLFLWCFQVGFHHGESVIECLLKMESNLSKNA